VCRAAARFAVVGRAVSGLRRRSSVSSRCQSMESRLGCTGRSGAPGLGRPSFGGIRTERFGRLAAAIRGLPCFTMVRRMTSMGSRPRFAGLLSGWHSQARFSRAETGRNRPLFASGCDSSRKQHQRSASLVLAFRSAPDSALRAAPGGGLLHSGPACAASHRGCSRRVASLAARVGSPIAPPGLAVDPKGFRPAYESAHLGAPSSFLGSRSYALPPSAGRLAR